MSLPKEIEDAANCGLRECGYDSEQEAGARHFLNGASWLYDFLTTTAAGEFDEWAAKSEADATHDEARDQFSFLDGARWQHAQDAAYIGRVNEGEKFIHSLYDDAREILALRREQIDSLERENAALRTAASSGVMRVQAIALAEADRIRDERATACTCATTKTICYVHGHPLAEEAT